MSDNEPYENWDGKCFDCGAPCEVDTGNGRLYDSGTDNQHHRYSCTIYRQARTIRRLRALADGYRERLRMTLDHCEMDEDIAAMDAETKERARIVAALRERAECIRRVVKAMQAVPRPDYRQIEYDQARADGVMSAADAIERGEL